MSTTPASSAQVHQQQDIPPGAVVIRHMNPGGRPRRFGPHVIPNNVAQAVAIAPTPDPQQKPNTSGTPLVISENHQGQFGESGSISGVAHDSPAPESSQTPQRFIPPGAILLKHVDPNSNSNSKSRKRGRPRFSIPSVHQPMPTTAAMPMPMPMPPQNFSTPKPTAKRARGETSGSTNTSRRTEEASGSSGNKLIGHVLNVKPGEDVALKIMTFSQKGPEGVCVMAATGALRSVTLRDDVSGGTSSYEGGSFEILSLNGSYILTEVGGRKRRSGGLSITLKGLDGALFGGGVAGILLAATPVQLILGSFTPVARSEGNHVEPSSAPPRVNVAAGTSSSQSGQTASPIN